MGGFRVHGLFCEYTWCVVVHRCVGHTLLFCGLVLFLVIPAVTGIESEVSVVVRFGIAELWAVFVLHGLFRDCTLRVVVRRCVG